MSKSPNILFILSDQLRADALGCYGNCFVRTPMIDRIASSGTVFENAYTPSPVCVPARCALITGQEPQRTGCFDNGFEMPVDQPTLMSSLTEAGYRTHGVGKMHFTPDRYELRGFETRDVGEEFGTVADDDYLRFLAERGYGYVERPHGLRSEMYYVPQLSAVPENLHFSHWVAERSIDFLKSRPIERPFFLWSSFIHPHPPFTPPSPWHRLYAPMLMPDPHRPDGEEDLLTLHNLQQNRYKFRDGGDDRRLLQLVRAYYLACVSFMDAQVGRILAALDEIEERENTLIVLASDHGELLGDYGCFGKRSFLDAAARVPLICNGPGFPKGRSKNLASLTDLMPTFERVAGADIDTGCESDGMPLDQTSDREVFYGQFQTGPLGLYGVITQNWKYVYSAADEREYLLDRRHDPQETHNLAYNTYCREDLHDMRTLARGHFSELADLDFDEKTHNVPLRLGGHHENADGFQSLFIDKDAGSLVLPDPISSDTVDPFYTPYWEG